MKRYFVFITVAVAAIFLSACIGSGGSSAPAPTDVRVTPKDGRVIVTWTMDSGVEYWIFHANASGVTPQNCASLPLCYTAVNVVSPASVSSLYNGYLYSFSVNGRRSGGPGGPGSVAQQTVPRLSGTGVGDATWTPGTSTTSNLRGVAYGAYLTKFMAAGDGGTLYAGTVYTIPDATLGAKTGITWTALTNPLPSAVFNAVSYDAYGNRYLLAGTGGAILQTTDTLTWTSQPSTTTKTTNDLYAIANNGGNTFVATGAAGTIITSLDGGVSWTAQTVSGSPALNGITYGTVTALGASRFVAVGAAGTVFWSPDGTTWTPASSTSVTTASGIKGVTYGLVGGFGTFVAVTADGKVLTSPDGDVWTTVFSGLPALNAVTASLNLAVLLSTTVTTATNAFVAVDNTGNIYQSTDGGVSWPKVYTGSTPLYAVTRGGLYDYSAVGASGVNLYAD